MNPERYLHRLGLVLVLAIAAFFLFYRVGQWPPPYPRPEEAAAGKDALAVLRGDVRLSYPDQGGGGALWVYLAALA